MNANTQNTDTITTQHRDSCEEIVDNIIDTIASKIGEATELDWHASRDLYRSSDRKYELYDDDVLYVVTCCTLFSVSIEITKYKRFKFLKWLFKNLIVEQEQVTLRAGKGLTDRQVDRVRSICDSETAKRISEKRERDKNEICEKIAKIYD